MNVRKAPNVDSAGNNEIAVLIPDRLGDQSLIGEDPRKQAIHDTKTFLSKRFIGSSKITQEEMEGSFQQDDDNTVHERVDKIGSFVKSEDLNDDNKKDLFDFASGLCGKLNQVCIGVLWDNELFFVYGIATTIERANFKQLPLHYQNLYAEFEARRISKATDFRFALTLNKWKATKEIDLDQDLPVVLATKGKRTAWFLSKNEHANTRFSRYYESMRSNDILFEDSIDESSVNVWLCDGSDLRGPRVYRICNTNTGSIPRQSFDLLLSLLEGSDSEPLTAIIDREGITKKFFLELAYQRDQVSKEFISAGVAPENARDESQRLLSSLLVCRFLEKQKALNGSVDYLKRLFASHRKDNGYYTHSLYKLFHEQLDCPPEDRASNRQSIPYLNGGLFRKTNFSNTQLPDKLFDPAEKQSVLGFLYRYEFTVAEDTAHTSSAAVDSKMLGQVLESFCSDDKKKQTGVHYTPPTIAGTLANRGIINVLNNRLGPGVTKKNLEDFINKSNLDALTEEHAEQLQRELLKVRILDPAVGSGSLLFACFETLLEIHQKCEERLTGRRMLPGTYALRNLARTFISDCLYGVDIDARAVEIAKLRFWLRIVLGDSNNLAPLPDLTENLQAGDSLSRVPLMQAFDQNQQSLEFDNYAEFTNLIREYKCAKMPEALELSEKIKKTRASLYKSRYREYAENERPFDWELQFSEVFHDTSSGFDMIIANPPYVSIQNQSVAPSQKELLRESFETLRGKDRDLYHAFVEQGLKLLKKDGHFAFILPNFSRTDSGSSLRKLLTEQRAISLWVDFVDKQVFPSATNYVVLLFGAKNRSQTTKYFPARVLPRAPIDLHQKNWLTKFAKARIAYSAPDAQESKWRICAKNDQTLLSKIESRSVRLGSIAKVYSGVQTSKDEIFFFDTLIKKTRSHVIVRTKHGKEVEIEKNALAKLAKGSKHIKQYESRSLLTIWPYDRNAELLSERDLQKRYPLAWAYLKSNQAALENREKGKFKGEGWWRFRQAPSKELAKRQAQLLIPAIIKYGHSMAALDLKGELVYPNSGPGGGGAWGLRLTDSAKGVSLEWLCACLNSQILWKWLSVEGEYFQDSWRGIGKSLVDEIPIPIPAPRSHQIVRQLVNDLVNDSYNCTFTEVLSQIEREVEKAYGVTG